MVGDGGALVQVMFGCCVLVYNLCVQCRAPLAQVAEGQYQHGYKLDTIRGESAAFMQVKVACFILLEIFENM